MTYQILETICDNVKIVDMNGIKCCYKEEDGYTSDHFDIVECVARAGISPKLYMHERTSEQSDIYIMELYDGNIHGLWPFISSNKRELYTLIIRDLIEKLHALDIIHLDLGCANIVYKENQDEMKFAIIDFETAMYISKIKDPHSTQYKMFNNKYKEPCIEYVLEQELIEWHDILKLNIAPNLRWPYELSIEGLIPSQYLNITHDEYQALMYNLSNILRWPLYIQDTQLILRVPGSEYALEIGGLVMRCEFGELYDTAKLSIINTKSDTVRILTDFMILYLKCTFSRALCILY